jgi:hypothetical protein
MCVCDDSFPGDIMGSESWIVSGRQLKLNSSVVEITVASAGLFAPMVKMGCVRRQIVIMKPF